MRILIDGAKVLTFREDKPLINEGYIYINKGVIAAVGEGPPPPEYEFAEYIIDGRGRIVLPGFALGIPNILQAPFRYISKCSRNPKECLNTLSKDEIRSLLEVYLTTLSFEGVTSVVAIADIDYIDVIAKAVSKSWIRTRLLLKDREELYEGVRTASKNVADQDAIPRGILSFGIISRDRIDIDQAELKSLNAFAYIDSCSTEVAEKLGERLVCINTFSTSCERRIVMDVIEMWRGDEGITFSDPRLTYPKNYVRMLRYNGLGSRDIVRIIASINPRSLGIGIHKLAEGAPADLIILNYCEPPYGPLIFDNDGLYDLVCDGMYAVETVIVGGDLVIDRFESLMIGKKEFETVKRIQIELTK